MFAVAPMMDWTDRHCRAFHRTLTRRALLYTEMVTADAILHGDRERLLGFDPVERPLALQLGGSDPAKLAAAARIGAGYGYDEINLNVGCPSDRVQNGRFGACLMREPALVAECVAAMGEAANGLPVTAKCRIGVDEQEPSEALFALVDSCAAAGVTTFIVHARKAWLSGLSPKENREVPPLDYPLVARLKRERPGLRILLNGGLADAHAGRAEMERGALDGVMLGRAAYKTPAALLHVDPLFYNEAAPAASARAAALAHIPYLERRLAEGVPLHAMTRHMLGLFHGAPGGKIWRRILSEEAPRAPNGLAALHQALSVIDEAAPREREIQAAS